MKEGVDKAGRWQVRGRQALLFCVAIALLSAVFSAAFLAGKGKGRDDGFFDSKRAGVFLDVIMYGQMYLIASALENQSEIPEKPDLISCIMRIWNYDISYRHLERESGRDSRLMTPYDFCGLMPEVYRIIYEGLGTDDADGFADGTDDSADAGGSADGE